ncbi:MAG: polymer-forming cytoskeletal protein [Casimicrobiaceae bacterium]
MLNFNRRDQAAPSADAAKSVLKPAIYDPPGSASHASGSPPRTAATHASDVPGAPRSGAPAPPPPPTASAAGAKPNAPDAPESKLFVGVNIQLKGVEICDCDVLVVEGHVEATVHSKAMEIAKPGTLKGNAEIDVAEIHGDFVGELTARTRLVIHGTGRVSGTIRYGKLIVAEGGQITGDIKRLDDAADAATVPVAREVAAMAAAGTRPALSPSGERWSN